MNHDSIINKKLLKLLRNNFFNNFFIKKIILIIMIEMIHYSMGCSQVVRQWTLTPSFVGSIPTIPVYLQL